MNAATTSVALVGGDVAAVQVEVHIGRAQAQFKLTGLPDTAVREAKERVRAAITSSGLAFPNRTVTVNLAPASLPKAGSDYDLPIALAIMAASGDVPRTDETIAVGELALDGSVRQVPGSLAAAVLSARTGIGALIPPSLPSDSTRRVSGARLKRVRTLADAADAIRVGADAFADEAELDGPVPRMRASGDLSEVVGQPMGVRAVEIAAAGGHHIFLHGPPGVGKSMLVRRLADLLPALSESEAIEVGLLHAAAGIDRGVVPERPFRSPHHTASRAALVGGGSGVPVPGEASLAHRGVLLLDEIAEFPRSHLDSLRQPLEDGHITISRRSGSISFPSRFQLAATANPCPCGFSGDDRRACDCSHSVIGRYQRRVSGPLVDRIDLVLRLGRVEPVDGSRPAPSTDGARDRVSAAHEFRSHRSGEIAAPAERMVRAAIDRGLLSMRGAGSVRRVARTIADLAAEDAVQEAHVAEALAFRGTW